MLIREASVSRNCDSSTRTDHSSQPLAAVACYQPAGQGTTPRACTSGKEENWSVCALPKRRWLWQQCVAAKTLNLCSSKASDGWSQPPTTDCQCPKDLLTQEHGKLLFSLQCKSFPIDSHLGRGLVVAEDRECMTHTKFSNYLELQSGHSEML